MTFRRGPGLAALFFVGGSTIGCGRIGYDEQSAIVASDTGDTLDATDAHLGPEMSTAPDAGRDGSDSARDTSVADVASLEAGSEGESSPNDDSPTTDGS